MAKREVRVTQRWDGGEATEDGVMVFKNSASEELKRNLAITDAKSLYDSLRREAGGKEPRVAIAVGEIKQSRSAVDGS